MFSGVTNPSLAALDRTLNWTLKFPTYCLGVLINGVFLAVMIRKRKTLLQTRIDLIYAFLMFVCFVWSVTEVLLFAVWGNSDELISGPETMNQIIATIQSLPVCLMISGNVQLALERYSILREVPWKSIRTTVYSYIAFAIAVTTTMLASFFTSPCSNQIFPDHKPQLLAWVISASLGFLVGFASIIYFYASTYSFIKQKLATNLADHHVDNLRMLLQRKVLRNSIIMTAGTLICYVPESIAITMLSMRLLNKNSVGGVVAISLCFEMVSLDVIVTPALILYFSEPLKNSIVLWRREGEDEGDGGDDEESSKKYPDTNGSSSYEMHYY
ncbi:hypothetical protein HDU98_006835 [Podochytrium sp. JEL0797]|nr:hypothetical protein HDU98_006835 [Podochytrium sp. JEL0797]